MRIAKPRNNADEAKRPPRVEERSSRPRRGPPRVEERSSRPRRRPHIRALPVAAFGPTHTRVEPKPEGTGPHLATEGRSAVSRRLAIGDLPLASRRFVHLIPESLRRDHAGLMQRFLKLASTVLLARRLSISDPADTSRA